MRDRPRICRRCDSHCHTRLLWLVGRVARSVHSRAVEPERSLMRPAQLLGLCSCNTVIFVGISAVVGLLPLHVAQLGGDAGVAGGVLALAYLALALSGVLGGFLSARSGRRTPWLIGG